MLLRSQDNVIGYTENGEIKYLTGTGFVFQAGYLLKSNWELVGRFTTVKPDEPDYSAIVAEDEFTVGISKYIVEHSLKVQTDFSYRERESRNDFYMFRFQVELAL